MIFHYHADNRTKWCTRVFAVCTLGEQQAVAQRNGILQAEEELSNAEHFLCLDGDNDEVNEELVNEELEDEYLFQLVTSDSHAEHRTGGLLRKRSTRLLCLRLAHRKPLTRSWARKFHVFKTRCVRCWDLCELTLLRRKLENCPREPRRRHISAYS
jgi:hypothetical protein